MFLPNIFTKAGFFKYFKNTSWLILEKSLKILVAIFIGAWIARYLGPTQFGTLNFAISFVAIFGSISSLGIQNIFIRELVKNNFDEDQIISTSFAVMFIGAFISFFLIYFSLFFFNFEKDVNLIIIFISFSIFFQVFNFIDFFFQSKVLSKYIAFTNIICLLFSTMFKVYLIIFDYPLLYFAFALSFDAFIIAIGYLIFFFRKSKFYLKNFKPIFSIALYLLKESWPLLISAIMITVYMKIDQIMIAQILNTTMLGYYAAGVTISSSFHFLPMVIAASVFPAIAQLIFDDRKLFDIRVKYLHRLMIFTAISLSLIIFSASDFLVNILFGNKYQLTSEVLKIHIFASIFVFIGVSNDKWLLANNLQLYSLINTFIGALTNILLNFIFIPKFGIIGSAWATLLSYFVAAYLSLLIWPKTRESFYLISKAFLFLK